MKVVVVGNGKVGHAIIEATCQEGHEVIVIDKKPNNIEDIININHTGHLVDLNTSWIDFLNTNSSTTGPTNITKKPTSIPYLLNNSSSIPCWFWDWPPPPNICVMKLPIIFARYAAATPTKHI